MRPVQRVQLVVPTLKVDGEGGRQADRHRQLRKTAPTAPLSFPDYWNRADVRGALYAMHGKVCAYCGCALPRNDRGDVDHFRPKSGIKGDPSHDGYWWLAYVFENYLLSCSPCNSTCKSNRFPLRPRALRVRYASRQGLAREARLLLDPARDPLEDWLRVDLDDPLCPIRPEPKLSSVARAQVATTLEFFRINTDARLVRERIDIRDHVIDALQTGQVSAARNMAIRYCPHSLVARQILIERDPKLCPRPEEELSWLLDDLHKDLGYALKLLERVEQELKANPRNNPLQEKNRTFLLGRVDELLWSFAVLWRNPPTGKPRAVETVLRARGIRDHVREFFDQLDAV